LIDLINREKKELFISLCRKKIISNLLMMKQILTVLTITKTAKVASRKRYLINKCSRNTICDRAFAVCFINSWNDNMFRRQFRLTRDDFWMLHNSLLQRMIQMGYSMEKHY
jgi:hypothetical protein